MRWMDKVMTYTPKIVHSKGEEPCVCKTVHEELCVARHAPDIGEVQDHMAVGFLWRGHVRCPPKKELSVLSAHSKESPHFVETYLTHWARP